VVQLRHTEPSVPKKPPHGHSQPSKRTSRHGHSQPSKRKPSTACVQL
jgi:hypothetical protein